MQKNLKQLVQEDANEGKKPGPEGTERNVWKLQHAMGVGGRC